MDRLINRYKVAEHRFSIEADKDSFLWEVMEECYGPFKVDGNGEDMLFTVEVKDSIDHDGGTLMYSDHERAQEGFISLDVFKQESGFLFLLTQPGGTEPNGRLFISDDYSFSEMSLHGSKIEQWLTFNAAVDFCFLLATACHKTLLTHSSAIVYEGKAYLFLGKSGTGKSTHSRMWLSAIEGSVLMNDDHPVIRVGEDGIPVAYGSPWSGKTHCYKNMSAPLGGIVRISRAPHNRAVRQMPIQAYASLMTSCSGMTWVKELADGKDKALQAVVSRVPCWVMECLPDEDAARVCCKSVHK